MSSDLCDACKSLTVESLIEGAHFGLTVLELESSKDSCECCQLIYEAIGDHTAGKDGAVVRLAIYLQTEFEVKRSRNHNATLDPGIIGVWLADGDSVPQERPHGFLRAFATQGCSDEVRKLLSRRPVKSPESDEALQNCSSWLTKCLAEHKHCRNGLSGDTYDVLKSPHLLPTRVIDVSGTPRLVVTSDLKANYVALSYCWGVALPEQLSTPAYLLTKATLEPFQQGIPHERLPRTIQHALQVTRRLGYRYLWVDSLCIVQDSAEDWSRESQHMGRIFQGASFTIAATAAASSHEGLFNRANPDIEISEDGGHRENFVRIPVAQHGHSIGDMCLAAVSPGCAQPTPFSLLLEEHRLSRWYDRAWVVQEKILSRRIIHFGRHQLFFECQEGEWAESFSTAPSPLKDLPGSRTEAKKEVFQRLTKESSLGRTLASSISLRGAQTRAVVAYDHIRYRIGLVDDTTLFDAQTKFWHRIAKQYNTTSLTRSSDKLVAILGLAKMLQSRLRMTYCAGAWIEDIACSLYWWDVTLLPDTQQDDSGENEARVPTWSWAARSGQRLFAAFLSDLDKSSPRVIDYCDHSQTPGATRSFLKIKAHAWQGSLRPVDRRQGNQIPEQAMEDWFVKWKPGLGSSLPLVPFPYDEKFSCEITWHAQDLPKAQLRGIARCDWGVPQPGGDMECLCLVMSSASTTAEHMPHPWFGYYVLIVKPASNETGAYERIGIGVCISSADALPSSWYGYDVRKEEFLLI